MANQQRQEQQSAVSAGRRQSEHKSGSERTTLKIPEGVTFFSPKKDTHKIDIIPYVVGKGNPFADEGEMYFERTFFVHRDIGPNSDAYICPAKTSKGTRPCPICEHMRKLAKDPDADEKLIKDLAPKERQLFWLIDLAEKDKGVQLWDISFHLFGKLLDTRIKKGDEAEGRQFFADLKRGKTLVLDVEDKTLGGGKPFRTVNAIDFKDRAEPYSKKILEQVHCLDDMILELPYDKLKRIFLQIEEPAEDEEETPKKKAPVQAEDDDQPAKPKAKAPPVEDDEDTPVPPKATKPPAAPTFKKGDTVTFEYPEGKKRTGEITGVNEAKGLAKVVAPGREEPYVMDLEDLVLVPKPSTVPDEDDDWDTTPPPKAAAKPKATKPLVDDDDDLPPPPKNKKVATPPPDDDDDVPASKKAVAKATKPPADDWD